jgi:DNA-binding transcriptional MerR regulator
LYTVKQVAEITGISAHTLRFYDNKGLFPYVPRDDNNVRLFAENHLEWINMIHCFRETGMSLADIKRYLELCELGKSTAEERYHIILDQKEKAEQEVINMQKRVEMLQKKTDYYKILLEDQNGDFWNPVNCAAASLANK